MCDHDRLQRLELRISALNIEVDEIGLRKQEYAAQESASGLQHRLIQLLIAVRTPRLGFTHDLWCVAILLLVPTVIAGLGLAIAFSHAWLAIVTFIASGVCMTLALIAPSTARLLSARNRLVEDIAAISDLYRESSARIDELTFAVVEFKREREEIVNSIEFRRSMIEDKARDLLSQSWEVLQGVAFEEFLVRVFENLGASVQLTPSTGDQGADLIAVLAGRRYAIQAKGGVSAIGNGAVMEALAGMQFYGCEVPVVITNSTFTSKAKELAQRCNCLLVDGSGVIELALGKHVGFQS